MIKRKKDNIIFFLVCFIIFNPNLPFCVFFLNLLPSSNKSPSHGCSSERELGEKGIWILSLVGLMGGWMIEWFVGWLVGWLVSPSLLQSSHPSQPKSFYVLIILGVKTWATFQLKNDTLACQISLLSLMCLLFIIAKHGGSKIVITPDLNTRRDWMS